MAPGQGKREFLLAVALPAEGYSHCLGKDHSMPGSTPRMQSGAAAGVRLGAEWQQWGSTRQTAGQQGGSSLGRVGRLDRQEAETLRDHTAHANGPRGPLCTLSWVHKARRTWGKLTCGRKQSPSFWIPPTPEWEGDSGGRMRASKPHNWPSAACP